MRPKVSVCWASQPGGSPTRKEFPGEQGSPDSVCRVPRSARVLQPQGSCTLRQKPTLLGIAAGHRGWAFRATGWEGPASPWNPAGLPDHCSQMPTEKEPEGQGLSPTPQPEAWGWGGVAQAPRKTHRGQLQADPGPRLPGERPGGRPVMWQG